MRFRTSWWRIVIEIIDVSIASIQQAIEHLYFTRKVVGKEVKERNDLLRAIWEGDMAQYDDPNLFLSSKNLMRRLSSEL
jgi:hypothetical protein